MSEDILLGIKLITCIALLAVDDWLIWRLYRRRFTLSPLSKSLNAQSEAYPYRDSNENPINKAVVIKELNSRTKQPSSQKDTNAKEANQYCFPDGYLHTPFLVKAYSLFIIKRLTTKSKQNLLMGTTI